MIDNDGFEGGRNDDHENVNRNSETPQKLFGTSGLLTSIFAKYTLSKKIRNFDIVPSIGLDSRIESLDS